MLRSVYEARAERILILRRIGFDFREMALLLNMNLSAVVSTWQRYRGIGRFNFHRGEDGTLSSEHRLARLVYVRTFIGWTASDWQNVLFTGVFHFYLSERFQQHLGQPDRASRGNSVMVWGGIFHSGRTALVRMVPPGFNAQRYVDDILQTHVLPIRTTIGEAFTLMQSHAAWSEAQTTSTFLRASNINVLPHPSQSPDLNAIVDVWDTIGNHLRNLSNQPANRDNLFETLNEIWEALPQDMIQNCINMPERLAEVMANGGRYRNQ